MAAFAAPDIGRIASKRCTRLCLGRAQPNFRAPPMPQSRHVRSRHCRIIPCVPLCRAASSDMLFPGNGPPAEPQSLLAPAGGLDPAEVSKWLRQYLPFSVIARDALFEMAQMVEVKKATPGELLQPMGSGPSFLYVVRSGNVQVTNSALEGAPSTQVGPGALLNFTELLLSAPCTTRISAATNCTLWVIPRERFQAWATARPELVLEIGLMMNQEMSGRLSLLRANIQEEERRQRALQPYLVSAPKRGVVGNSKYADRLRKAILTASRDPVRGAVMVFGEPGLEKDNLAALIHFGGGTRSKPMVMVDCDSMDSQLTELFGRGSREGLLHWIRDGTVLLSNVHMAPKALLPSLVTLVTRRMYQPAPGVLATGSLDLPAPARPCEARILFTAEKRVPELEGLATVIKVPPLRVRPADILDLYRYQIRAVAKKRGETLALTPEAERQLLSYAFPGNTEELFTTVERAAVQASDAATTVAVAAGAAATAAGAGAAGAAAAAAAAKGPVTLDKDVFWFAAEPKDRFKWNLLTSYPLLRTFLKSDFFPEQLNHGFIKYVFAVVVAILFIGPQDRQHNFCLNVFWDYWWPGSFLVYPFLGRIWCSICPFMIYGEVVQRWREAGGHKLMKWPRDKMELWGGWFLFGLFAGILVWEEVWDLPNTAYLSSWLLLIITGGAMVCSYFFERRLWCRYLCPIGGMNGLFAKLSMTELRARHGVCSGTCSTYHCYKGGPAEGEGQETLGCPLYTHPAQLTDNKDCVLCMTCLKACPHRSIEVRVRPPGFDLWSGHTATWHEVCLLYMLMGAVYLHRLPELKDQFGVSAALFADKGPHILVSSLILAAPGLFCWASDILMRGIVQVQQLQLQLQQSSPATAGAAAGGAVAAAAAGGGGRTGGSGLRGLDAMPPAFLQMSYAYLPLLWGATLAHYTEPLMEEAGTILPVTAATFGLDGSRLPVVVAEHAVTCFLQGGLLLGSAGLSLLLTRKLAGRRWRVLLPQAAAVVALTAELWYLIVR